MKIRKVLLPVLSLSLISSVTLISAPASAVCNTQKCSAALEAYQTAVKNAEKAQTKVNTLEGEIERLDAEIEAMESKIEANKAIVEDLKVQIAEQKAILEQQQAGLAEIESDVHFKKKESDLIQALKYSISERAEKKARDENVKAQISSSVNKVNENMKALQIKQAQVEALVKDQQEQSDKIAENKARRSELKTRYENDAAKFSEDAEQAKEKLRQAEEEAKVVAKHNSSGRYDYGIPNTYELEWRCPQENYTNNGGKVYPDRYGFAICQCTSYANWKVVEYWGKPVTSFGDPELRMYATWRDAKTWGSAARTVGLREDSIPEAHSVGYQTYGRFGHVVWVESVNSNGTITVSEYNNSGFSRSGLKGDYDARTNVPANSFRYIHFK